MSKKVNKIIGLINKAHKENNTRLSSHNISLGALSDMKAAGKETENSLKMLEDIEKLLAQKSLLLKKSIDEVNEYSDKYIQRAKRAERDITNAKKAIKDIDDLSEELEMPTSKITGYEKIITDTKRLEDNVNNAASTVKRYKQF